MVQNHKADVEPESTQGEEQTPEGKATAQPSYMTAEQVNKAMTAYLKKFEKLIDAKLAKPEPVEPEASSEAKPDPKRDNELIKKIQLLEKRDAEREAVFKAREAALRDKELRSTLTEHLVQAGAAKHLVKQAVGYLVDSEKAVAHDEDGQIVWKVGSDQYTDLATAARAYIKTEDAKAWLAPRGTTGSGSGPIRSIARPQPKQTLTSDDVASALIAAMNGTGE